MKWVHTYGELGTSFIEYLLYTCCSAKAGASVTLFRVIPLAMLGCIPARVRLRDTAVTTRADPPFLEDTPNSEIPLQLVNYYVPPIYTWITY